MIARNDVSHLDRLKYDMIRTFEKSQYSDLVVQMYNSPITLSKDNKNHILTILIVLEEEFVRNHGDCVNVNRIIDNQTFKKLAEDNRYVSNKPEDRAYIQSFLEDLIQKNERFKGKYEVKLVEKSQRRRDQKPTMRIFRKNKYSIKSDKDLELQIRKHPGGLEVDDQLLKFTYKKVNDDLERLYKENTFRKLMKERTNTNYLIFPKTEEKQLQIYQNEHKEYDFRRYLEMCAKINAKLPEKDSGDNKKSGGQKKNLPDPNYKLQGYTELKEEWLKKNLKK